MKTLMTNSTHPNILVGKMRDESYVKHLREVQKINNRQALNLHSQIKQYNELYQSHDKLKKQARDFGFQEKMMRIQKKNQKMNIKMNNIRSMFNFNNLKKMQKRSQSAVLQHENTLNESKIHSNRYNPEFTVNETVNILEVDQLNVISQQISNCITNNVAKNQEYKKKGITLHYYLRKRQQQMIELENNKLMRGILSQKSVYTSPQRRKMNKSSKLPSVVTGRYTNVESVNVNMEERKAGEQESKREEVKNKKKIVNRGKHRHQKDLEYKKEEKQMKAEGNQSNSK